MSEPTARSRRSARARRRGRGEPAGRQLEAERGARTRRAAYAQATAVRLGDGARDGEPEPCPVAHRGGTACERLEDARLILFAQAGPGVLDLEHAAAVLALDPHPDR